MNARDIRAEEVEHAWLYRIGVPLPLEGTIVDAPQPTRRVRMAKNVYFDEVITEARENERVRWTYRFYPDSFPPYALDEHVVVGGRYFDVHDTSYTLARRSDATELPNARRIPREHPLQLSTRTPLRASYWAGLIASNAELLPRARRRSARVQRDDGLRGGRPRPRRRPRSSIVERAAELQ